MKELTRAISIDAIKLKPKKRYSQKKTPEQEKRHKAAQLKHKLFRGDLDMSKQNDLRLFYWGIKNGFIDKDGNPIE